jgi:preprotein translocase subunit SecA
VIDIEIVKSLSSVTINEETNAADVEQQDNAGAIAQHEEPVADSEAAEESNTVEREGEKVGRNDPCPCGSGKKYKNCHG